MFRSGVAVVEPWLEPRFVSAGLERQTLLLIPDGQSKAWIRIRINRHLFYALNIIVLYCGFDDPVERLVDIFY